MSEVIQFPLLRGEYTKEDLACLTDLTEHPLMSDLYNTANLSTKNQQAIESAETGWSNQDLADLYRAQRLLALAGINTEIDQGLTDEGDPWFIFMDTSGDVFVHFSRFDGMYMAASMLQDDPVWADNLHDLVSEFSRKIQPVDEVPENQTNVVSLASRNTVVIHPAAALAALVWSIYLMSDKLVNAAPAPLEDIALVSNVALSEANHSLDNTSTSDDTNDTATDVEALPAEITQRAERLLTEKNTAKAGDNEYQLRDSNLLSHIAMLSTNHSANVAGVGLSLVALALGIPLMSPKDKSDTDHTDFTLSIDESDGSFDLTSNRVDIEALDSADMTGTAIKPVLDLFLEQESSAALEEAATEIDAGLAADLKALASSLIGKSKDSDLDTLTHPHKENDITANELQDINLSSTTLVPVNSSNDAKMLTTPLSADSAFLATLDITLSDYKVINLEAFDLSNLEGVLSIDDDLITDDQIFSSTTQLAGFNDQARKLINFLLNGDHDITILTTSTEVIFIDGSAIEESSQSAPIHTASWSLDDGGIISTVGFKSDFHLFDLVG